MRLAISALVLGVPTFLMGGTLPAAVRAVTVCEDHQRRGAALLYGANTLGAVVGALGSTFFALEFFGTRETLWLACLVNLGTALSALALCALRRWPRACRASTAGRRRRQSGETQQRARARPGSPRHRCRRTSSISWPASQASRSSSWNSFGTACFARFSVGPPSRSG